MGSKKTNKGKNATRYARFWCLIKEREFHIDKDEMVLQFTDGRTTHLGQMTNSEYNEMCDAIEGRFNRTVYQQQLKKARSSVLLRIARLGINTIDNWEEVNAFLLSPKIAGKVLYEMDVNELKCLVKKLEAIKNKGGLKKIKEEESVQAVAAMPIIINNHQHKYLS